jgi:protein-disulfide isomerase
MSKRQDIREQRRKEKNRNRLLIILMVVAGALLIVFAMILPSIQNRQTSAQATQTVMNAAQAPVIPITPRVINATVNGLHIGDPKAPIKVDVWEDFQCPACASYSNETEPQIITNYVETGLVYYTFHMYPFIDGMGITGGESDQAANAAMCASEQDKFWDYHDLLFANWNGENQGAFADPRLVVLAENLGLDMAAFNKCFEANTYVAEINQDLQAGQAAGVQGTPSVFVDGTIVTPGYIPSYDQLAQAIEAALAGK